jgi:galacturan 1,4-alpha-galacturonidase
MEYVSGKVKGLKVAYIGGGSRGWAWGFMKDLAMDAQMDGVVRLYDIDRDAAEKNKKIGEMISAHKDAKSRWRYEVSSTLKEALTGADFVVISILPGTFLEMRSDVHWPERYGVWQPVGDTAGPGGFMRAMRTVPMFVEIAEAIRDCAPEAWVINYTNPMTVCMRTLYTVFPRIKAFGCCHEVFGTQKLLAAMLEDMEGIKSVERTQIKTGVTGINHFTWLYNASYEGQDLFPLYRRFALKYYETGFKKGKDENWMNNSFECSHRVKFDLFLRYGLIAAAGDRHLAEFMMPWYLKNPETVRSWGFGLTTVDWREEDLQKRLDKREALLSGKEPVVLDGSGEEGHLLIKALLGLGDTVSNVNIPNRGQIENLPGDAVVETNALFRRNEIAPVFAGVLPKGIDALVTRQVIGQENTVKAAMTCDYYLGLATFLNDPQMAAVSPNDGEKMFREMLQNTMEYLPKGWRDVVQ